MKKIIRLTESDLAKIVKRVIKESEEEYVDLDNLGGSDDIVTFDYRRERNKEKLIRNLVFEESDYKTRTYTQNFKDLLYGYNRFNEKIVKVRQDSRFGVNEGLDDTVILYNCTTDEIRYDETNASELQKDADKDWLGAWCSKINWNSKVGKKKGLFRK
jgi:hypothetical protein